MITHQVMPFDYGDHLLRVISTEPPQFVAKDVCEILTIQNHRDAIAGIDDDEKGVERVYTPGGPQKVLTLYEAGFYTILIRSNKPEAKPFRRWVTHEVLPSIRKTGFYSTDEKFSDPYKIGSLPHMAEDEAALERMFRKRKKGLMEVGFDKSTAVRKSLESIRKDTEKRKRRDRRFGEIILVLRDFWVMKYDNGSGLCQLSVSS